MLMFFRYGYSAGEYPESYERFLEILDEKNRLESLGKRPDLPPVL